MEKEPNIKKFLDNLTEEQTKSLEQSLIKSIQDALDNNGGVLDLTKGYNPLPNMIMKSIYDADASPKEIHKIDKEVKKRYKKKL